MLATWAALLGRAVELVGHGQLGDPGYRSHSPRPYFSFHSGFVIASEIASGDALM
jgi:hypothetical protein